MDGLVSKKRFGWTIQMSATGTKSNRTVMPKTEATNQGQGPRESEGH